MPQKYEPGLAVNEQGVQGQNRLTRPGLPGQAEWPLRRQWEELEMPKLWPGALCSGSWFREESRGWLGEGRS